MARRAVLAMMGGPDRAVAIAACDLVDGIARRGDGWRGSRPEMRALAGIRRGRDNEAALEGVRWAYDSAGAAQGANDFPVDAIVGASAQRCLAAIGEDPRVSPLQIAILAAADVDLLAFACAESHVHMYDPLGADVFGRLTPCHPLTLTPPRPSAEEEAR